MNINDLQPKFTTPEEGEPEYQWLERAMEVMKEHKWRDEGVAMRSALADLPAFYDALKNLLETHHQVAVAETHYEKAACEEIFRKSFSAALALLRKHSK